MHDKTSADATTDKTAPGDEDAAPQPDAGQSSPPAAPAEDDYVPLWNNLITMGGVFMVVIGLILILTFSLFSLVSPTANPYVDIVGYLVLPSILIMGLLIAPIGIVFKRWRLLRKDPHRHVAMRFPRIDLRDPLQRRVIKFFVIVTFLALPVVGVSAYHGYHYTDSVSFCAEACHTVMEPEATTFAHSPHARVSCAECHIGSGASWFVKSKLSGTRQVFATLRDSYPRPIPPAISNLRPARETCEHCHWPQKFYGAQLAEIVRYASDENNTRQEIDMLLKIGGGDESSGPAEGIHMHMALAGKIEYVAVDEELQEIPWVRWTDKTGKKLIYRSDGRPSSDPPPPGSVRQFDCMDCHNRPAHNFRPPQHAVDVFLEIGRIDRNLPFIKREAVAALVEPYPDRPNAEARIGDTIMAFYRNNYPEQWSTHRAAINQAVDGIREIYRKNFFPDMRVNWRTYPDNIGHKFYPGCFRCHDNEHINQHGESISYECGICHTFLNPVNKSGVIQEGEFVHPTALPGLHAQLKCHECHSGGPAMASTCQGCHAAEQDLYSASLPVWQDLGITPNPMASMVDCEGCHDVEERVTLEAVDTLCMECHEDEEEEYEGMLAGWAENVAAKRRATEAAILELMTWIESHHEPGLDDHEAIEWVERSRRTMSLLDQAGPLHNPAGAMQAYDRLGEEAAKHFAALQRLSATATPPAES